MSWTLTCNHCGYTTEVDTLNEGQAVEQQHAVTCPAR